MHFLTFKMGHPKSTQQRKSYCRIATAEAPDYSPSSADIRNNIILFVMFETYLLRNATYLILLGMSTHPEGELQRYADRWDNRPLRC